MKSMTDIEDFPLDSGDFSLLDRKVVDTLVAFPEKTAFFVVCGLGRGFGKWGWNTNVVRVLRESPNTLLKSCLV